MRAVIAGLIYFLFSLALVGCQGERGAPGKIGGPGDDGPPGESTPQINSIIADPPIVTPGDTTHITARVSCLADKPDPIFELQCWECGSDSGTIFPDALIISHSGVLWTVEAYWIAPLNDGSYILQLEAKDGGSTSIGDVLVNVGLRPYLQIESITVKDSSVFPGQSTPVEAEVYYRGKKQLSFSWRVSHDGGTIIERGPGVEDEPNLHLYQATWVAPLDSGKYNIRFWVGETDSDTTHADSKTVTVSVDPARLLRIESIEATPPTVHPGGKSQMTARITYRGENQLSWSWEPTRGGGTIIERGHGVKVFENNDIYEFEAVFVAPVTPGNREISFEVSDGKISRSQTVDIAVDASEYLQLESVIAEPSTVIPGEMTRITARVIYRGGNQLGYSWGASPEGGTISERGPGVNIGNDTFEYEAAFLTSLTGTSNYTITFTVRDGSFSASDSVEVALEPLLSYDDGVPDNFFTVSKGSSTCAVRFTAIQACIVEEALFYFHAEDTWTVPKVRIIVWDDNGGFPGTPIGSIGVQSSDLEFDKWFAVDLRELNISFDREPNFHIGFDIVTISARDSLGIAHDDGLPAGKGLRSSAEKSPGVWTTLDYNLFIRAVVRNELRDAELSPAGCSSQWGGFRQKGPSSRGIFWLRSQQR